MVTVEATGKREVKSIQIKPECVDPDDVDMLQDLILARSMRRCAPPRRRGKRKCPN
jgi:DNA-binding protein YbaB